MHRLCVVLVLAAWFALAPAPLQARERVAFDLDVPAGTIVVRASERALYLDLGDGTLATGFLIHPRAVEALTGFRQRPIRQGEDGLYRIVDHVKEPDEVYADQPEELDPERMILPWAEVPEAERRYRFWLADQELVDAWLALHVPAGTGAAE